MKKDYFPQLISEICHEYGIELTTLNNGQIRILSRYGEEKIIWSKKFELNSVTSARIADNKSSTYEVLKQYNIPCINYKRHFCHYKNSFCYLDSNSIQSIQNDLQKYRELVLKPENGYEGIDVYRCYCIEDISRIIDSFHKPYTYICSSPYYHIKAEYRTICLNGKAMLSYKKNLPYIIGNGKDTTYQLIQQKYTVSSHSFLQEITDDIYEQIPHYGEKVIVGWRYNLSQGAESSPIVNSTTLKIIQDISLKAAKAIHINFSSVDVIETYDGEFLVMEINSGVVLNQFIEDNLQNYDIAKKIYSNAILAMFKKTMDNTELSIE